MRGKGPPRRSEFLHTRITPAYAGKSDSFYVKLLDTADHPRLCGEKLSDMGKKALSAGSPPPMRGKAVLPDAIITAVGITPAYAGKSEQRPADLHAVRDHPRLCGEKSGFIIRHPV